MPVPDIASSVSGAPVSLAPSSFVEEQIDLSTLSLEEVVSRYKDTERKRTTATEPAGDEEVLWRVRSAPRELLSSLRLAAACLGVSRAVLTRCMSRHMVDWYINSLDLANLSKAYTDVYTCIKRQTYSTLRIQAEYPARFSLVHHVESANAAISTIRWALSQLSEVKDVLGVSVHDLLMIGLMWSLTRLGDKGVDRNSVNHFFGPEVYNFETLIADRKADVMALRMKYEYRENTGYNSHIFVQESAERYGV